MKKISFIILFLFVFSFPVLAAVRINPDKIYDEGVAAFESSKYDKVLDLFKQAFDAGLDGEKLQNAKSIIRTITNKIYDEGRVAYESDKYEKAMDLFKQATDAGLQGEKLNQAIIMVKKINDIKMYDIYYKGIKAFNSKAYKAAIIFFEKAVNVGLPDKYIKFCYQYLYYCALLTGSDKVNQYKSKVDDKGLIEDPDLYNLAMDFRLAVLNNDFRKFKELIHPLSLQCSSDEIIKKSVEIYKSEFVIMKEIFVTNIIRTIEEQSKLISEGYYMPNVPKGAIVPTVVIRGDCCIMGFDAYKYDGKWRILNACKK